MTRIIISALGLAGLAVLAWVLVRQASEITLPSSAKAFAAASRDKGMAGTEGGNILSRALFPGAAKEEEVQIIYPSNKGHARVVERRIARYITSGDREEWLRMFNELLDLSVPRDEAIRIAKKYLDHPEPFIRYGAANTLYKIGDRSGATTLIQLVL
ncbi:MAG TPA: hypothetical protein VF593_02330, partial [Chthoniobacteraceae bacterium]